MRAQPGPGPEHERLEAEQGTRSGRRASDRICVAQIGGPHGVRGEVRLRSFTEEPASFVRYGPLETEDGSRKLEPESVRSASEGSLVVHFKGIADRDAAVRLRGLRLFIPRTRLPPLEEDTYYHADLIGLSALGPDDVPVGTVCAVHNFGAGDLLEIAPVSGGPSLMVPFTKEAVPVVDLPGRRLRMAMTGAPAGRLSAQNSCG